MSRPPRAAEGGLIYHAMNRANVGLTLFASDADFEAFERVLDEAVARFETRLLAYCVLPNHFHLVVWPRADGDLSRFMRWLTMTHTQRWHASHRSAGSGHVYQGRFRSFPVQDDAHFLTLCRYVERNALSAGLVARAEDWRWGSLKRRIPAGTRESAGPTPHPWPVARPADWVKRVNAPPSPAEEDALRLAIARNQPFGAPEWRAETANRLGLASTLRPLGRPRKPSRNDG